MKYLIRAEVLGIKKYIAGKPISELKRELGLSNVVKLASNENSLGCSPKAKKAILELMEDVAIYPDASAYEVKKAISEKFNIEPSQVFCGNGSDSLIRVICNTLLNKDDECIIGKITFPRYETNTKLMGSKPVLIPMTKDLALDINAMVDNINDKTKIIWFCNPNNPTGNIFTKDKLEQIIDKIPKSVYFVMDEAYMEYVCDKNYPDSISMLEKYPNLIILRTFSKAYGLASLRFGYGIANEELVEYFNRVINSFDSNAFAQKIAIASLEDDEFLQKVVSINNEQREFLSKNFERIGIKYIKSYANFILVNVNGDDEPIYNYLLRKGYIIRPGFLLGIKGWIRVTIGTEKQNKKFIELLKDAIKFRDQKI